MFERLPGSVAIKSSEREILVFGLGIVVDVIVKVFPDPDVVVPELPKTLRIFPAATAVPELVTNEIGTSVGTPEFLNLIPPA